MEINILETALDDSVFRVELSGPMQEILCRAYMTMNSCLGVENPCLPSTYGVNPNLDDD